MLEAEAQYAIATPLTFLIEGIISTSQTGAVSSLVQVSLPKGAARLLNVSFTPTSSGKYTILVGSTLLPVIQVVARTDQDYLREIEDESLGSWSWNKATGLLSLLRQNGTPLATFNVTDTLTSSTKERLT